MPPWVLALGRAVELSCELGDSYFPAMTNYRCMAFLAPASFELWVARTHLNRKAMSEARYVGQFEAISLNLGRSHLNFGSGFALQSQHERSRSKNLTHRR